MLDFSIAATLIAIFIVVFLFYILIKVLMKDEEVVDNSWEVGPTCKPVVVPLTNIDPDSGQKLDPAEVKEIMEIIKNQPEELIAPPVLSSEYNPIIQPPPEEKAVAKPKKKTTKKTPAKKTTTRKKVKKTNS